MLPDMKEWNVPLIKQIFYPFDADDICRIPIPKSDVRDCIAWHPEKNGIFTVRSAYKLAAAAKNNAALEASSSTNNSEDRSIWDLIWKAEVPPKVRVFGWRVATNTLATKRNKFRRTITFDATCDICGCGDEDEHHAVVGCTKSRAPRHKMREEWDIPSEKQFQNTGEDWL
uniref:Reverse transcriptase zinc-binding domain-containing protein n=1 Tax=Triticum urartu TaxID=4572 RepID=A0A8R7UBP0_TRIUA